MFTVFTLKLILTLAVKQLKKLMYSSNFSWNRIQFASYGNLFEVCKIMNSNKFYEDLLNWISGIARGFSSNLNCAWRLPLLKFGAIWIKHHGAPYSNKNLFCRKLSWISLIMPLAIHSGVQSLHSIPFKTTEVRCLSFKLYENL